MNIDDLHTLSGIGIIPFVEDVAGLGIGVENRLLRHPLITAIALTQHADGAENFEAEERAYGFARSHAGHDARAMAIDLIAIGVGLKAGRRFAVPVRVIKTDGNAFGGVGPRRGSGRRGQGQ